MRKRKIYFILYYLLAAWLPATVKPFGRLARRVRRFYARRMFVSCGKNVNVERKAYFGFNEVSLGDNSGIGINFHLQGASLVIGNDVLMGPNVTVLGAGHNFEDPDTPIRLQGNKPKTHLEVGDDVWIGQGVTILPGTKHIGKGAVVGACSVVTRDVPEYAVVAGNPARIVRYRGKSE